MSNGTSTNSATIESKARWSLRVLAGLFVYSAAAVFGSALVLRVALSSSTPLLKLAGMAGFVLCVVAGTAGGKYCAARLRRHN